MGISIPERKLDPQQGILQASLVAVGSKSEFQFGLGTEGNDPDPDILRTLTYVEPFYKSCNEGQFFVKVGLTAQTGGFVHHEEDVSRLVVAR